MSIDLLLSTNKAQRKEIAVRCYEAYRALGRKSCRGCALDGYCPHITQATRQRQQAQGS